MRTRRPVRRRLVVTAGVSGLAHLALLLALGHLPLDAPPAPERDAEAPVVEIDLRDLPPPAPDEPPDPVPPPPTRPRADAPARPRADAPRPPAGPGRPRVATRPPTAAPAPAATPAPAAAPGPPAPSLLRLRPAAGADAPRAPADLSLTPEILGRLEASGALAAAPASPPLPPRRGAAARRAAPEAERHVHEAGRRVVQAGRAHPYLFDLGRDARARFHPGQPALSGDPRDLGAAQSVKSWGRGLVEGYKSRLRSLRTGEELPRVVGRPAPLRLPDPLHDRATDVLAQYAELYDMAAAGAAKISCEVCVALAPGGEPRFELRRSSDNPTIDRMAEEALARAVARAPRPEDLAQVRACYHFDVRVTRLPPAPVVGCDFDEASGAAGCYRPLDEVMKVDVRLESAGPSGG